MLNVSNPKNGHAGTLSRPSSIAIKDTFAGCRMSSCSSDPDDGMQHVSVALDEALVNITKRYLKNKSKK